MQIKSFCIRSRAICVALYVVVCFFLYKLHDISEKVNIERIKNHKITLTNSRILFKNKL